MVARQRRNYSEAEQLYQNALSSLRHLGQRQDIATVLISLGALERECQNYDAAERYLREALEIRQNQDKENMMPAVFSHWGELNLDREQWTDARKWFTQALQLAKEIGWHDLIAHAQYGLARVHEAEGRADLALPLAQEALKIYERLQHRDLAEARELVERLKGKV